MGHGRLAINIELGFIWPPVNLVRFHLYFVFGGLLYSTTGIGVYGELFLLKGQNLWFYFFFSFGLLGDNYENNNNKNTVFECGIIIDKLSRKSFSLRFFLLIILFLIFEIEIILFVPVRITQDFVLLDMLILLSLIIFMLGGGLLYE